MICDFVEVGNSVDLVGTDVLLGAERLELTKDTNVLAVQLLRDTLCCVGFRVDPLLYVYRARAVIDDVRDIGGLLGNTPYASDECDLCQPLACRLDFKGGGSARG